MKEHSLCDEKPYAPGEYDLTSKFHSQLQIAYRDMLPTDFVGFMNYIFSDHDRVVYCLQIILSEYAYEAEVVKLELLLRDGGSGWRVYLAEDDKGESYFDIQERVPPLVQQFANKSLTQNSKLSEAWKYLYSRTPDLEKTVQYCQDVLEGLLRDKYLPNDMKPQLGKLIRSIKESQEIQMQFKGSSLLEDDKILLDLLSKIPKYRGLHTAGTGKTPTKEEAEYVMMTTIYFWNLHNA